MLRQAISDVYLNVLYVLMQVNDAYTVLVREKKLPLSLLEDPEAKKGAKQSRAHLLTAQPFTSTFGKKQTRKRPRLAMESYAELLDSAEATGTQ